MGWFDIQGIRVWWLLGLAAACSEPPPEPPLIEEPAPRAAPSDHLLMTTALVAPALEQVPATPGGGASRQESTLRRQACAVRLGPLHWARLGAREEARFELLHPQIDLDLQQDTDRGALDQLAQGHCDVALVAVPLTPQDQAHGLIGHRVGTFVAALVVHRSRALRSLSVDQVRRVLTGAESSWLALGESDEPIELFAGEGRWERALAASLLIEGDGFSPRTLLLADDAAVAAAVRSRPHALGVLDSSPLAESDAARALAIDGAEPWLGAHPNPAYRQQRALLAVTRGQPGEATALLVRWLTQR
jgi:ABC-type phosphate transport system substrate-binding protein